MLTINADEHPFMRNFQKPQDEKRSVVILPSERYDDWLLASAVEATHTQREGAAQGQAWAAPARCERP